MAETLRDCAGEQKSEETLEPGWYWVKLSQGAPWVPAMILIFADGILWHLGTGGIADVSIIGPRIEPPADSREG